MVGWIGDNLVLLLALGWALYFVVLACWIVLQKREPVATLSWLLSLAALPWLGFLIYYLLGPERIRRHRSRRLRARAAVRTDRAPGSGEHEADPLEHMLERITGFPPTSCTRVRLLVDGGRTYDHLLAAIAEARHHVHLEYYIFEPDHTGAMVRDALVERARAGVQVRLLVDAVGAHRLGARFLRPLREAGAEIARFHPVALSRIGRPRLNMRSHRKIVVVDGRVGFTGGINICDENNERRSGTAYHDLHLRLEGEIVGWLQVAFLEDWHYATRRSPRDARLWAAAEPGPVRAQVVPSGPDSPWEPMHRTFVGLINAAQRRVWLVSPYFAPDPAAVMALTSAAMKGLDVRVLLPHRSDSLVATAVARSWYDVLVDAGIAVFEYRERMVHSKALLIDDDRALIGSANFDHRSFHSNFELGVVFSDREVARRLEELIAGDCRHADRVVARHLRHALPMRLWIAFARLLSPLV